MYSLLLFDRVFLVFDASEELMERISEFLHAFVEQLLGHLIVMDAKSLQVTEGNVCFGDVVFDAAADATVVAATELLGESKLATLDERHFTVVRPAHAAALTLLP